MKAGDQRMRLSYAGLAGAWLLAGSLMAGAEDIRIVKPGAPKLTVDLSDLAGAGGAVSVFKQTLTKDLNRSGWFDVVSQGGGAIAVSGPCQEGGAGLTARCDLRNLSTGRTYFTGRNYSDTSARAAHLAHALADDIVFAVKGRPGMASSRIVMVGAQGTSKDLYLCDADGGNLTRLTSKGAPCISPRWSPDGSKIVFTSMQSGYPDVYTLDLGSGRQDRVSNFPGLNSGANYSPDGSSVILTLSKDGNPDLYLIDIRSRNIKRITHTPHASEASPSWSPDGRRIVFVSDKAGSPQMYIMDMASGTEKRITFQGSENVAPQWGADGRIVHSSKRNGIYQVCVYDPSSEQRPQQLTNDGASYEDPSWAPDGRHIVCSRTVAYHADLYVLDTLGDPPVRLLAVKGDWYCPSWSPARRAR